MGAGPWLFAAQAAFSIASEINDYNDGVEAAYIDFANKRRQAAFNNRLAYNALLNTNEQEQLFQKKHALDKFQLNKNIQRAIASRMALQGSAQKSGALFEGVVYDIMSKCNTKYQITKKTKCIMVKKNSTYILHKLLHQYWNI